MTTINKFNTKYEDHLRITEAQNIGNGRKMLTVQKKLEENTWYSYKVLVNRFESYESAIFDTKEN